MLAFVHHLLSADERMYVTGCPLNEPPPAGRQVVNELGVGEAQALEINDVQVRAVAGCEHAAVE